MLTFYLSLILISILSPKMETNAASIVWDKHYSVSSSDLLNSDLERISSKMLAALGLLVDDSKLERLQHLAQSQPEPKEGYHDVHFENYDYGTDYDNIDVHKNQSLKREVPERSEEVVVDTILNGTNKELDYDLEKFKEEYDTATLMTPDIATLRYANQTDIAESDEIEGEFQVTMELEEVSRCVHMALWKHAVFGPVCIVTEFANLSAMKYFYSIPLLILKTLFVWASIYCFVAPIMWCYDGMCFCCFPFEILHPDKGIREIRERMATEEEEIISPESPKWLIRLQEQKNKLLLDLKYVVMK
ncbi:hypothetical protein J6590_090804 [Homalodisca vitripennis]|nr:hypothetical protein J6590_090804 [Homalodisca vitripennis]